MSEIANLIDRMKVIPEKEQRATQLGDMIAIRDKLHEAADRADRLRTLAKVLDVVEGTEFLDRAKQDLTQGATTANNLRKRYDTGIGFERRRADEALTRINERLNNASSAIDKGWRTLVDDQAKRFKPLAVAAGRATLPGADALTDAITSLEAWRDSPPPTPQAAQQYITSAERLRTSIAGLGLQGRAGRFMVDASNGRAKAKDLQDAEVLAFLDAYPAVWPILKVGL